MDRSYPTRLIGALNWVVLFILVLLPFHEFITTWIGSNFGHLDLWRIWKEIIILACLPFVSYLILKNKALRQKIVHDWLIWLITAYALLTVAIGLWAHHVRKVNTAALGDGIIVDLRFLAFFVVALVTAAYSDFLKKHWRQILLIPGALVVLFGVAQLFLPYNFLSHFGYGAKTIPAYSTVNQTSEYRRIQSTLRGADPLGAYLVLLIPAVLIGLMGKNKRFIRVLLLGLSLIVLFFTYSRSAWLGLALSILLLAYWYYIKPAWRKRLIVVCAILALLVAGSIIGFRHNLTAEDVFFHTSSGSKSPLSSNTVHFSSWKAGLNDLIHQPLGGGTGTAGPASAHNNHPARIAENYYLQIGQETGWLGLILFIAINLIVVVRLCRAKSSQLALLLLVSFAGISLINLFAHEWADDTLSLIWWGLAGIALTPVIIKNKSNQQKTAQNHGNKKKLQPAQES